MVLKPFPVRIIHGTTPKYDAITTTLKYRLQDFNGSIHRLKNVAAVIVVPSIRKYGFVVSNTTTNTKTLCYHRTNVRRDILGPLQKSIGKIYRRE